MTKPAQNIDTSKVNRVEIINHREDGRGREYVEWHEDNVVEILPLQDEGRTLKIVITQKKAITKE